MRSKKTIFLICAALLLIVAAAAGWRYFRPGPSANARGNPAAPATTRVQRRDIHYNIEISGDVNPAQQIEIKPEVSARVMQLHVVAGQQVKKDDLLCELDDRDLRTQRDGILTDVENARLTVERNKLNFGRGQGLFEAKLSSKEAFDNLSNDLALAENSLVKTQRSLQLIDYQLTKTRILAPGNGTVLSLPVVEGQVVIAAASVSSGTSLMTVANLADLIVVAQVNQVDVAKLAVGQAVKVSMDALKEPPMNATIRFISPLATVKNNVKGFQVEAHIDNPSARLRPGMTVNLTVPIESADNALSVPVNAVFDETGERKVIYVRKGEQSEQRTVKLGVTDYFFTQIISGAAEGEEVLLTAPATTKGKS